MILRAGVERLCPAGKSRQWPRALAGQRETARGSVRPCSRYVPGFPRAAQSITWGSEFTLAPYPPISVLRFIR